MSSIRRFLIVTLLCSMAAITVATGLWTYYSIQSDIDDLLDAELIEASRVLQTLFSNTLEKPDLDKLQAGLADFPEEVAPPLVKGESLTVYEHKRKIKRAFQIWDAQGRLLLRSYNAPIYPFANDEPGFSETHIGAVEWRVYTQINHRHNFRFQVAQQSNIRTELEEAVAREYLYYFLLMCPLVAALLWSIVGYGFRHLYRAAREVNTRDPNNLEPVRLRKVPIEIEPLINAINRLLERLHNAFEREKRFTADAAHELRTPLAALKTQAQVAMRTADEKQQLNALNNVVQCVDRCNHVVTQLLTLSRLRPDQAINDVVLLDMSQTAAEVIADLAFMAVEKDIDIELITDPLPALITGNITALKILLRNLIDNAIRYTPEKGSVKVITEVTATHVLCKVIDTGPGIAPELHERVFERFYRSLGTQSCGSGLGLSIAQQIVNLHKGNILLKTPPQGGLEVCVVFANA